MFKNRSKKMTYRIILLILVDMLIITLSGPLAIYVRYNLFFEARAIEFIENIFRYLPINLIITIGDFLRFPPISGNLEICQCFRSGQYYSGMSGLCCNTVGWHVVDASGLSEKLSVYVFFYTDFWHICISLHVPHFGICSAEKRRTDSYREKKYDDSGCWGSGKYIAQRTPE